LDAIGREFTAVKRIGALYIFASGVTARASAKSSPLN